MTFSMNTTNEPVAHQPERQDLASGIQPPTAALVVFVPGLGLDARSWQAVRDGLSEETQVVLLPSMGQPAPRGTDLSVPRQAERVLAALPVGRPVVLVGHSASAPVVVESATRSTGVVGLVLIGSVTDPRAATWARMLSQWVRTATHEKAGEAKTLVPQYRRTGILSMLRGMNAVRAFRTDLALAQLDVPVEVLRGQRDRIAPEDWSTSLSRAAGGRMTTVASAAHMVPITHAAAVVTAIHSIQAALADRSHTVRDSAVSLSVERP
jgi:pimeloyl-ACP methyl ester carboxylesterase